MIFNGKADMGPVVTGAARLQGFQIALLGSAIGVGLATTTAEDWSRGWLFGALVVFALISQPIPLTSKKIEVNGAFISIVLTSVLIGPLPGALAGIVTMLAYELRHRRSLALTLANVSTYAVFPLVSGFVFQLADGPALIADKDVAVIPLVVGAFLAANIVNFLLIAIDIAVVDGVSVQTSAREVYADVFPVEFAVAVLTGAVSFAFALYGDVALLLLALVALVFQYLLRVAFRAVERGSELEDRNQQLASLQVGLISTMVKTLSLRDHMTARHSAAVARYAREMAAELGLGEQEQDLIHTAALFHDIGKFIFPDSILLANTRLSDEDFAIVRRHPEVGAEIIGEIDGYGPVAEVVRHHHERIDGKGYPDAIAGDDIPLGSRIIAVADVYDVITARDTYRKPVSTTEAIAELRRVAGTQLDADLVELFVGIIESRGVSFRHSTSADFEAELHLERRVRDYAAPRIAA